MEVPTAVVVVEVPRAVVEVPTAVVVVEVPTAVVVVEAPVETRVIPVVEGITGKGGYIVAVQVSAVPLKPDPVNVKTVLTVPEVGVTITSAVTLKMANGVRSCAGVPLTVRFQGMFVVA
jgi:hypothetical protein